MAFGIPGSEPANSGDTRFLGRIQYDARVGFWKIVKRVQDETGRFNSEESEPFKNPTLIMDMGSLEAGYIKIGSPPGFAVVPMGQPWPAYPDEMMIDAQGKQRKAYMPGVRVKVANSELFGDEDAYYFSVNSKTALEPMERLYKLFATSPEAATGLVPVVACTGTEIIKIETKQGESKYHAPVFEIVDWVERVPSFGERTVPPPLPVEGQAQPAPAPATPPTPAARPAMRHSIPASKAPAAASGAPKFPPFAGAAKPSMPTDW